MPLLYLRKHTRMSRWSSAFSVNPYNEMTSYFHRFPSLVSMLVRIQWHEYLRFISQIPIHQPLHGLKKKQCETDRSIVSRSTIGSPTMLRYKHYLNLLPNGWKIGRTQAGKKYSEHVWDNSLSFLLQHGRDMPSTPGLLYEAKESIAHSIFLQVTTLLANLQSEHLARRAAKGAGNSCITSKLGKCVFSQSSKVSPSDCVHLPE